MALRQINAGLNSYNIQAERTVWQREPLCFRIHGRAAWWCRRRGHTTALLAHTSGAPPGCPPCRGRTSRCRRVGRGGFLLLGNTQMEALLDCGHLRKNPHLPLKTRKRVKGHILIWINPLFYKYWTAGGKYDWKGDVVKQFRSYYGTAFEQIKRKIGFVLTVDQ